MNLPRVHRLSWLSGILALCCALLLTGCGVFSSSGSEGESSSGETRVVKDIDDQEVEVPADPQRIVTLSEPTLDGLLALGLKPVGTVAGRGQSGVPNYLADRAGDVEVIGTVAQPDYEKISALNPDLILVDGTSVNNRPDVLEILREIAPVVFCGYAGGPWELNFGLVADAVNRADEGKKIQDEYEQRTSEAAEHLAERYADSTFSVVRWQGGGPSLILKELPAGQALESLGLRRPPSQDREGRGHSEPVSLENLSSIDADYMFFGTLGGASQDNPVSDGTADLEGARQALETAEDTSGFTDLKAYQKDHIILVDGSLWTSTGGPLLMNGIVDQILAELGD